MLPRRNNAAELDAFYAVCDRLNGFDPALNWEYVDGWLCGLAAGPQLQPLERWLQALCGDAFDRSFADPPDRAQALRALKTRLAVLLDQLDAEALLDTPDMLRLEPLMVEWTEAERAEVAAAVGAAESVAEIAQWQTGAVWAHGFLDAVQALHPAWLQEPPADAAPASDDSLPAMHRGDLLAQVQALCMTPDDPAWSVHLQRWFDGQAPDRDTLIDAAMLAVQDLRVLAVDDVPVPATRRVQPAPGRNDPCPCGSGRKYKKCHGAG